MMHKEQNRAHETQKCSKIYRFLGTQDAHQQTVLSTQRRQSLQKLETAKFLHQECVVLKRLLVQELCRRNQAYGILDLEGLQQN